MFEIIIRKRFNNILENPYNIVDKKWVNFHQNVEQKQPLKPPKLYGCLGHDYMGGKPPKPP